MPIVERAQRFVRILNIHEVVEEVTLTFRLPQYCVNGIDVACFERYIEIDNDRVGTYLAQPNGDYALIEGVYGPRNEALIILGPEDLREYGMTGESDKYICVKLGERLQPNGVYTITFKLRKPNPLIRMEGEGVKLIKVFRPYFDAVIRANIVAINSSTIGITGQRHYVQYLLDNESMEFTGLSGRREAEGSSHFIINHEKDRVSVYEIRGSYITTLYYAVTLSPFYKILTQLMSISAIGIMALSIALLTGLIPDVIAVLATTLSVMLLSGYIVIPKESLIHYRWLQGTIMASILMLVISGVTLVILESVKLNVLWIKAAAAILIPILAITLSHYLVRNA
ncbi:hypothetical protein JCM16161A_01960 [Vulcanisaeta sp. JCM 16161]